MPSSVNSTNSKYYSLPTAPLELGHACSWSTLSTFSSTTEEQGHLYLFFDIEDKLPKKMSLPADFGKMNWITCVDL
jgi:hypothetical protein